MGWDSPLPTVAPSARRLDRRRLGGTCTLDCQRAAGGPAGGPPALRRRRYARRRTIRAAGPAAAAERLQKIARGESEANTPRKSERPQTRAASAALENVTLLHRVPLTRHTFLIDSSFERVLAMKLLAPLAIFCSRYRGGRSAVGLTALHQFTRQRAAGGPAGGPPALRRRYALRDFGAAHEQIGHFSKS